MKMILVTLLALTVLALSGCGKSLPYVDPCDIDPYNCPGGISGR